MLCPYSALFFRKGYAMKMNKRILSYSGRLHPLSVCQRCGCLGTEEKKQPGENLSNGVDAGMGARATFV